MIKEVYHGMKKYGAMGLYTAGGAVLAGQLGRVPAIAETAKSLESTVQEALIHVQVNPQLANYLVSGVEIALAAGLIKTTMDAIKRHRKEADFKQFMAGQQSPSASSEKSGSDTPKPVMKDGVPVVQTPRSPAYQAAAKAASAVGRVAGPVTRAAIHAGPAVGAAALLFASYKGFPQAWASFANGVEQLVHEAGTGFDMMGHAVVAKIDPLLFAKTGYHLPTTPLGQHLSDLYSMLVGANATPPLEIPSKVAAGLAMTTAGAYIRSEATSRKHGPILKQYDVDGKVFPGLVWKNIRQGLQRAVQDTDLLQLPSDARINAGVTVTDFRTGAVRSDDLISYRIGHEPNPRKSGVTVDDCGKIVARLQQHKLSKGGDSKQTVLGEEVQAIAAECGLLGEIDAMSKNKATVNKAHDMLDIVAVLSENPKEDVAKLTNPELHARTMNLYATEGNGGFHRMYLEMDNGSPIVRLTLTESPAEAIKETKAYYGPGFARKGKLLQVLNFKFMTGKTGAGDHSVVDIHDGHDGHGGHQGEDGQDHQFQDPTQFNEVRQYRKVWNTAIREGLGQAFIVNFLGKKYVYEERWAASGGFLDLVPGLWNKNLRFKRRGYISDTTGAIVAQFEETSGLSKMIGNYDARVKIYDRTLADTDSFGMLMCLLSQYMTHQNRYIKNRLENPQAILA